MQPKSVSHIVIAGGGTAGWMTAAYLARWLESTDIRVTLVESDQIGTVGVGEATVPGIHEFIQHLGVRESEFIKATHGTFKLGIEFEGWAAPDKSFFHPFAGYGVDIEDRPFYKSWWQAREQGYAPGLEEFCLGTQLARAGKFAQPSFDQESRLAWYNYAYHFDASLFAKYLRGYAERRKVARIEGKINQVQLCPETGFIQCLQLESGAQIAGDLFIDCSGFSALLIGRAMGVGYEDWSHWLLSDSALAVQTKTTTEPDPFTRSIARSAGWQWHIPLQHRVGNGYVYSSQFISQDQAQAELLANLKGELVTEPRLIRFTTGMREQFWHKNCVAIGLSSGFLEPLESTSISLIQTGINKLAAFLVNYEIQAKYVAEANRLNRLEYERIRDFIILHYALNGRAEPMWQQVREIAIPAALAEKIECFKATGDIKLLAQESFVEASWVSMFYGFGMSPGKFAPQMEQEKLQFIMNKMKNAITKGRDIAPSHAEFLESLAQFQ
ncbi:tryptophan halogenase family protein [Cellvibrio sp. NN19]|uniref:tryptophan halogenase family protein n=1 Tax=Cellvibrio chitinivorans TaxID=3102792 RepID=UPI002B410FFE|nr:tryptophan halogenase family protein [Cellvibrio sp. NN19]